MDIQSYFLGILQRGTTVVTACLVPFELHSPSKMGSNLNGKNLLQEEQILSIKSRAPLIKEAKANIA